MPVFNNNDLQNVVGGLASIFGNPVEENKMRLNVQTLQGRQGLADLLSGGAASIGADGLPRFAPDRFGQLLGSSALTDGSSGIHTLFSAAGIAPNAVAQINAHNAAAAASSSAAQLNKQKFGFEQQKYNTEQENLKSLAEQVSQNGLPTSLTGDSDVGRMVAAALMSGNLGTFASSIASGTQAKLHEQDLDFKKQQYADKLTGQNNLRDIFLQNAVRPDGSVDPQRYGELLAAAASSGNLDGVASLQRMASEAGFHQKQIELKQKEYSDKLGQANAFAEAVKSGIQVQPATGRLTLAPNAAPQTLAALAPDADSLKKIGDALGGGTPLTNAKGQAIQQAMEQGAITPAQVASAELYPGQNISEGSSFLPSPNDPRLQQSGQPAQPAQTGGVADAFIGPQAPQAPAQSIVPQGASVVPATPQGGGVPPSSSAIPAGAFDPSKLSKGAAEALANASQGPAKNSILVQQGNILSNMKVSGVPQELVEKISRTMTFMEQARNAIKALESNPSAVGGVLQKLSPELSMRWNSNPAVGDVAGLVQSVAAAKAHELYGGAYTANEVERSALFLPSIGKNAKLNADNIRNLYQESAMKLRSMLANLPRGASIDSSTVRRAGELFRMPESSMLGGYSGTDATQNVGYMPTPPKPGTKATPNVIHQFLDITGNDVQEAERRLKAQGWVIPNVDK